MAPKLHRFTFVDRPTGTPRVWGEGRTPQAARKQAEWALTKYLQERPDFCREDFLGQFVLAPE